MFTEKKYGAKDKKNGGACFCVEILILFLSVVLFSAPYKLSAGSNGSPENYPVPVKKLSDARKHALSLRAKFRPELKKQLEQDATRDPFRQNPASLQPVKTMTPVQKTAENSGKNTLPQNRNQSSASVRHIPADGTAPAIRVIPMPANARPTVDISSPVRTAPVRTAPVAASPVRTSPIRTAPAAASPVRTSPVHTAPVLRTVTVPRQTVSVPAGITPRRTADAGTLQTASPVKIRLVKIGNDRYCFLNDIALYYRMRIRYYRNGVELFSPGKSIRFYNDKRTGSINNVPVSFLYAPVVRAKTQYFIHSKDALILLASTMSSIAVTSPVRTIMLDPGHGGTDHGALGTYIHEKQMNLNTALLVRAGLTRLGYKVVMTRSKDKTLTLDERTAFCKKMKPDLFVSIHCNAAGNKSVSGIETFAPTPFGVPSTGKKTAANIKKADPGNAFDRNNYRLAYEIQKSLITQTSAVDRGVKVARYKVIRDASCPAALVEIGFITNAAEQKKFINAAHRNKIVNGIVLGIHNYVKSLTLVRPSKNSNMKTTFRRGK